MKQVRLIWNDIRTGKNLDTYLTVILAVMVAILSVFNILDQEIVSSAVLATLALVAVSILHNRRKDEKIWEVLEKIDVDNYPSEKFFHINDFEELAVQIRVAQTAFFWGLKLQRTLYSWDMALEKGLKNGLHVRFLLLKPDSAALEMAAFTNELRTTMERETNDLEVVFSRLAALAISANARGNLELRVINFLPPWAIVSVNPQSSNGRMAVLPYGFRVSPEDRPSFMLSASADEKWFNFYVMQFESVWNEAEIIELDKYY